MRSAGQLFVISAPSGSGKSTIIEALRKNIEGLGYSVSHTTREPRGQEKNGVNYHFVNKETFDQMIDTKAFVEWAKVYDYYYGTSFSILDEQMASGFDILLDLDIEGARSIKSHFENSVLIYIVPPSLEVLKKRLEDRGENGEKAIKLRTDRAHKEIASCIWYDYIVINDELEQAVKEAEAIILSERCKTDQRAPIVKELFGISSQRSE